MNRVTESCLFSMSTNCYDVEFLCAAEIWNDDFKRWQTADSSK